MKTRVGKYLISARIARGGMGDILKAKHPTLNKDVILKRLAFGSNEVIIERFKREAQLQIDFRNDNIVQVYDHFKEGMSYYIVMEYVDGISLDKLIDKNRYLPNEIALLIFYEICRALKYAHDKDVIHRDIKPGNVLISKEGVVKLTDFGIATSKDSQDQYLTREMTLGTPAYMSPEQISDSRNVDKRADIYSMGVVLYEMVTGKCPFPSVLSPETISRIQKGKYIKPGRLNPKVSPLARRIIKKAMNHRKKKRYKDLQEIINILSKELRRFKSREMINETIQAYITGKTADIKKARKRGNSIPGISPKRGILRTVSVSGIILLILSWAGFYAYKKGYQYEIYRTNEFGALRAEVKINSALRDATVRYIRGNLYLRTAKGYTQAGNTDIQFSSADREKESGMVTYISPRIYARSDSYRIMVDIDNKVYQYDFFLRPRAVQKLEKKFSNAQVISISHTPLASMPLSISYEVRDSSSGRNITDEIECSINYLNRWVKWQDFIQKAESQKFLESGKTYFFRFQNDNYSNRVVSIDVMPYQAEANIQAELVPLPGTLLIKSNEPGVEVLINNSEYYMDGGYNTRFLKLEPLTPRVRQIVLSPNSYYITARIGTHIKTESVEISPRKFTRVIVNVDKDKNTIDFNIF